MGDNTQRQPADSNLNLRGPSWPDMSNVLPLLSGLIQKGLQAAGGTDTAQTASEPTPTVNPTTGLHDNAASILQSAVDKHLKEKATDFVSLNGPEVAQQLLDYHFSTSPSQGGISSPQTVAPQSSPSVSPLQQQAMDVNNPQGVHPLGTALNILGALTGVGTALEAQKEMKLGNISKTQEILGQTPIEQSDIEKSALETSQKINQALTVPPTQSEKLSNAAAYAGYKTTALKDMLDNNNTSMTQQNEVLKNMQGYSSWFNKPFGAMPKEAQSAVKKLQQLQLERIAVSSELNKHQQLLASGGVSTSPFKEGQVYTDANGNTATFKNGKFQ